MKKIILTALLVVISTLGHTSNQEDEETRVRDLRESDLAGGPFGPRSFSRTTIVKFNQELQPSIESSTTNDFEVRYVYLNNYSCTIYGSNRDKNKKVLDVKKGARYGVYSRRYNAGLLRLGISNMYRRPGGLYIRCRVSMDATIAELEELLDGAVSFKL